MKKITIIGVRASGKSTLARGLGKTLNIPVCFTDSLWWNADWKVADEEFVEKKVREVLESESWIIEGYIQPFGKEKLELADVVIYLDYPSSAIVWNGLKRWFSHRKTPRPELPEGCVEQMSWEDFKILVFRKERGEIEEILQKSKIKKLLRFKSRKQLYQWLESF